VRRTTVVTSVAVLLATLPQRGHLGLLEEALSAVPAMQAIFEALDGIESDMAGASGQRTTQARHWTSALQPWLHCTVTLTSGSVVPGEWVLLTYHMPRDPSTPRSAVWRKLRRLGVAQLADGLVALPADARTREQLDWLAVEIREAAGTAAVWLARPASVAQERDLAAAMAAERGAEYIAVQQEAETAVALDEPARRRAARRLREELRRVRRRDFFPPPEREAAVAAVEALAAGAGIAPPRVPAPVEKAARR
jgi:ChrB-like protein